MLKSLPVARINDKKALLAQVTHLIASNSKHLSLQVNPDGSFNSGAMIGKALERVQGSDLLPYVQNAVNTCPPPSGPSDVSYGSIHCLKLITILEISVHVPVAWMWL